MQNYTRISITAEEIVPTAEKMREEKRLLVMIHAYLEKDGTPVITYDYDDGPNILSYEVRGEKTVPTISHIYDAAAEWPEREINELMDITFEGLDVSKRLFLPDNLLEGKGQILVTPIDELRRGNGLI
ncbi:MAG: NADH-quinone oxidoreductase subunit C [Lachnospiraceae bacterium]|nr:NADH-quinone oxidoreductase subunit C [Eubacterium sp.]MBQ6364498.1 NADH-quinone oxidoreductase subunit C [Lachnospiraceae bacterium]MBR2996364.1 NADH-quinone oxidoreductase subunit C [Lachnospiraceae bacterium]MBR3364355.1 NADH-quinone oxidoreductase subunit C [Solobacterium sp.]